MHRERSPERAAVPCSLERAGARVGHLDASGATPRWRALALQIAVLFVGTATLRHPGSAPSPPRCPTRR